jgi:phosphoglycolate phosphatase-like HAD superfamily hydrolase
MKAIYFDMDGTIADLYGYEGWLDMLHAEDTTPYEMCGVLVDLEELREVLDAFIEAGITIGVISWGAKNGSREYCKRIRKAKKDWCNYYFPNIFTEFHVVKYGTPKHYVRKIKDSILVDDNEDVRQAWKGETVDATQDIIELLQSILKTLEEERQSASMWQNNFIQEYQHAMSPMFLDKIVNTEMGGGLYLLGQTAFNPHTNQKYYWVKVGTTNNAKSRFSHYRTDTPTMYFIDWVSHKEEAHSEEWYHHVLDAICLRRHRFEWFQVTEEVYLKICEKGFVHFN